ncbi:MAG: ATP-binding protein [Rhizobiaceae bacterium]
MLKNLQKKYVSGSPPPAVGIPARDDLDSVSWRDEQSAPIGATLQESTAEKTPMRQKRRSAADKAKWLDKQRADQSLSRLQKILLKINPWSSVPHQGSGSDMEDLRQRNRALADRLENLEDRSWEVRESEEIHRSLAEAFGDVVLHRNAQGELVFQNRIYDTYFGDLIVPDLSTTWKDPSGAQVNQTTTREIELETLKGRRWFSWTDLPVRDPQTGAVGIRSVGRDITEQKNSQQQILTALEKAEHANEAKSRFLAMVSHEIRTPLNGIIGMAGLLSDGELAPDQKSYVDAINSSGSTLLNLIEDLLDTARIESGHVELTPRPTNLNHLVEDVAELLAPAAQEKGLALATYVAPEISPEVWVDSGRLRQILLNLVGNAVKFTKSGGVGLNVTIADDAQLNENGFLKFSVRDSGPGLSEEDQQRIFEEFVQTDEGATREHGGAGLGLAISKNLVELMDGKIEVSSRLGHGTGFELVVRAQAVDKEEQNHAQRQVISDNIALILPRNPARHSMIQAIKGLGATVSTFDSVEAFQLNHQSEAPFDAVIAPFADWSEERLTRLKRELQGSTRLISIGSGTVTGSASSPGHSNIDAWLTRPVRQQTLHRVLANQLTEDSNDNHDLPADRITMSPLNILLAEDNPINALLAKSLLNKMGHRVIHVVDGSQAVEAVEGHEFDLILMDLHMPVMDGLAALEKISAMAREKASTPIIVLSADGQAAAKDEALAKGARDYLVKPIKPEDLQEILVQNTRCG